MKVLAVPGRGLRGGGHRAVRAGLALVAWLLCLLAAGPLQAQTLDEVDLRPQGDALVVRIRFNASVRLLQLIPSTAADFYTLRFEILSAEESVLRQASEEFKRLPAGNGLPEIGIEYGADPGNRVKQLTIRLGHVLPMQARQGVNARSIELLLRPVRPAAAAPASAPQINTTAAQPADVEAAATDDPAQAAIEREASTLIERARADMAAKRPDATVVALNQLLKLPPNRQSMAAQALIGTAWEEAGNPLRARVEFSLYLKLYPQGEAAGRVAAQLAALGGPIAPTTPSMPGAGGGAPAPNEPSRAWNGTVAQYYYGGKARSKSLVNIATGIDQSTLSRTTESSIVTSLDLSTRFAGWGGENRAVVRGSGANNLLNNAQNSSSIGAVYLEHRRSGDGLAVRVGRQSPISGGLLGLFDGVSLAYPLASGLKLDVMGGVPASALVSAPSERLFAAVLEADSFLERWGGNAYLLDQATQGITNRRSVGAELRYAGEQWSTNMLLDYDALFGKVNALSVHGSFQIGQQTTLTVLADERRAPSLQLTNALISSGAASLKDLLRQRSLDQVRSDALATSATARQMMVSLSRPINERWQMSMDLRYSAVGALPAVGDFEATAATGAQYNVSAQLTGTNLYSSRDINNVNLSIITTPFFKGLQLSYNNLTGLSYNDHEVTLEPSARLYTQRDQLDVKLLRLGPGVRLTYRQSRRASLLAELLYEISRTEGPVNHDNSSSAFFYVGYRYELF